ncbi:hypothetical protein [Sphingomonas sp. SUN039]|uniref:hypothetical protein n=1 Tax=Sphingomonas sp. SUN039 TaxID=2937787 RepID=UPI002164E7B1|nr:hypothetical protein [Sphingomonas sp. SUN039]UVO53164.1 hypothetical protein M0209_03135 [Sphingomonas sp. SUN039]
MSQGSNWVSSQEARSAKRKQMLFVCAFALFALVSGADVARNFSQLTAQLGLTWDGVVAVAKLINPMMFGALALMHLRSNDGADG